MNDGLKKAVESFIKAPNSSLKFEIQHIDIPKVPNPVSL
jgi:hypothetical protein